MTPRFAHWVILGFRSLLESVGRLEVAFLVRAKHTGDKPTPSVYLPVADVIELLSEESSQSQLKTNDKGLTFGEIGAMKGFAGGAVTTGTTAVVTTTSDDWKLVLAVVGGSLLFLLALGVLIYVMCLRRPSEQKAYVQDTGADTWATAWGSRFKQPMAASPPWVAGERVYTHNYLNPAGAHGIVRTPAYPAYV